MIAKFGGAVLAFIGAIMVIVNAPLEPFDYNLKGPLVIIFEFAGPLIFIFGSTIFGYQLKSYLNEREWPETVPQKLLVVSIVTGFIISIIVFLYRVL